MYRGTYCVRTYSAPNCTALLMEPKNIAKSYAPLQNGIKHEPRKDRIEGESDETTKKTRQQLRRLTERQRAILIRTFAELETNPVKNALKILVMLFAEHPQYKQIWPRFREIPDSSLMNAIELRRHASVYMCGLGAIIHSMNRENDLAIQMNRIARAHIKWNVYRIHIV
ncbi:GLOBIN domain-containing protein, partial [Trichostrongylus colubriformis]